MLISSDYRELNRSLHAERPEYGISALRFVEMTQKIADAMGTRDVLDYGCGKRRLAAGLEFPIQCYDPCIDGLDRRPRPADLVCCIDVLEHIEPDCIDAVLDDLQALAKRTAFMTIDTGPARKTLADGRNAHILQRPAEWWRAKLDARFHVKQFDVSDTGRKILVIADTDTLPS